MRVTAMPVQYLHRQSIANRDHHADCNSQSNGNAYVKPNGNPHVKPDGQSDRNTHAVGKDLELPGSTTRRSLLDRRRPDDTRHAR